MPYILTVRERNHSWAGRPPVTSAHATPSEAETALLEYVRRNWSAEMETEPPHDPGAMIEEYFAEVLEIFDIVESV